MPSGHIGRYEFGRQNADVRLGINNHAALGTCLPGMTPLRISRENNPRRFAYYFAMVNVA